LIKILQITGTLYDDICTFIIKLTEFFLEGQMFQRKDVEKIKKHLII